MNSVWARNRLARHGDPRCCLATDFGDCAGFPWRYSPRGSCCRRRQPTRRRAVGPAAARPAELAALSPDALARIHPRLIEQVRGSAPGPIEFLVVLDRQAALDGSRRIRGAEARRRWVYEELTGTARASQRRLLRLLTDRGVEHRSFWVVNMIWVRGDRALLAEIAGRHEVRRLDANLTVRMKPPTPTTDPAIGKGEATLGWNITQVRADEAWALGFTGQGIVVGGQDTGYAWEHPALIDAYRGFDGAAVSHDYNWHDSIHSEGGRCGADSPFPCDDGSHGTHTMGSMIGDDGATNQIGLAPDARWIGCRNMDRGNGTPVTYSECFQWFIAPTDSNGENPDPSRAPHVINNSWICPPSEGCAADTMKTVVENTRAAGIVVVASAGNSGPGCESINTPPPIFDAAFTVGATNSADAIASFSSRGPVSVDGSSRLKPDVVAPGISVRSSVPPDGYSAFSGTSMSGPQVVGVVALLLSAQPELIGRVDEIEFILRNSAVPLTTAQECGGIPGSSVPNPTYGWGRVDVVEAIRGDADGDLISNATDCLPADPTTWSPPGPATDLTLREGGGTAIEWSEASQPGATETRYTVLRTDAPDSFGGAVCIDSAPGGGAVTDHDVPQDAFYYLIQTENDCGAQAGAGSDGQPRALPGCS